MSSATKQKYIIKRTGRRCTRYPVVLADGTTKILNAVGTHVWELTAGDAAKIAQLKDTKVRQVKPKAKKQPKAPAPKAKAAAPKKAAPKKK